MNFEVDVPEGEPESPTRNPEVLARLMALKVRETPPPTTVEEERRLEFDRAHAEYLGGEKKLQKDEEIANKYSDPNALWEEWTRHELRFVADNVSLSDVRGARRKLTLEPFQRQMLRCRADVLTCLKGRRMGVSWIAVADAVAMTHLNDSADYYFISRSLEEAKERIKDAANIVDTLPPHIAKDFASTSVKARLEFWDGPQRRRRSRIISWPQVEPRGIQGALTLDEVGFYPRQEEVIKAAVFTIARGEGTKLWMITTPGAKGDRFSQVHESILRLESIRQRRLQLDDATAKNMGLDVNDAIFRALRSKKVNGFTLPWWNSRVLVKPNHFEQALLECPKLKDTKARIDQFGSDELLLIWFILDEDIAAFRREEECEYYDVQDAYYSRELIDESTYDMVSRDDVDIDVGQEYLPDLAEAREKDKSGRLLSQVELAMRRARVSPLFFTDLDKLASALRRGHIGQGKFYLGVDPGDVDGWALVLWEYVHGMAICRYAKKFRKVDLGHRDTYLHVEAHILKLGQIVPLQGTKIDANGQGKVLIGKLKRSNRFGPTKVHAFDPTAKRNGQLANTAKILMERELLALPRDESVPNRRIEYSIVRDFRRVQKAERGAVLTIEVERDKSGHGDLFYAGVYGLSLFAKVDGRGDAHRVGTGGAEAFPKREYNKIVETKTVKGKSFPVVKHDFALSRDYGKMPPGPWDGGSERRLPSLPGLGLGGRFDDI